MRLFIVSVVLILLFREIGGASEWKIFLLTFMAAIGIVFSIIQDIKEIIK